LRPKKFQRLVETLKPLLAVMKKEIS